MGTVLCLTIIQLVSALLNTVGLCREGAAAKQWVPLLKSSESPALQAIKRTDTHTHNCQADQCPHPPLLSPETACVTSAAHSAPCSGPGTWVLSLPAAAWAKQRLPKPPSAWVFSYRDPISSTPLSLTKTFGAFTLSLQNSKAISFNMVLALWTGSALSTLFFKQSVL